ncbi:acyltransferase [Bacteroides caecimuris]|uniref:acyltransferase family protein n=1 Tax=Bacteroides caecimuris TaxID=1796613 RepID=UPI0026706C5A|nr:acyltransferase [Bacteroides caecimuris]
MNTLDLSFISRFRSSFMGFAIFWIFFYHTGVDIPVLKHFFALGWLGVDIFFFLSGFGLSASLAKDSSFKRFFRKRFVRIIPCWWIVLAGMAFFGSVVSLKGFPITAEDYFHWFSGTGWWLAGCNFEWYIPTLLVFYLLAPLLSSMSIRQLSICAVVAAIIAVALSSGIVNCFNHVYMSYSRLPVYLSGFIMYKIWKSKACISFTNASGLALIGALAFAIGFYVKSIDFILGLTIARVFVSLLMVPMLFIISLLFKYTPINRAMAFMGVISLEMYLLHINSQFSHWVEANLLSGIHEWLVKLVWFAMVLTSAWVLHRGIDYINSLGSFKIYDTVKR